MGSGDGIRRASEMFARSFEPWGIQLPDEGVKHRARGKINKAGWTIWYLFGSDEKGEYLDYYATHRMTSDSHTRIREAVSYTHLTLPTN